MRCYYHRNYFLPVIRSEGKLNCHSWLLEMRIATVCINKVKIMEYYKEVLQFRVVLL